MTQPEALSKDEPLKWSTGSGIDLWNLINASIEGNLEAIKELLQKDPSLVRSAYDYRPAIAFAVRENQPAVVEYLLSKGANPVNSGTDDTLLQIANHRGFKQVQQLLEEAINIHIASSGPWLCTPTAIFFASSG